MKTMSKPLRFLILDGYPKASRDQFDEVGMKLAWALYRDMLVKYLPDAEYDVWLSSDDLKGGATEEDLKGYAGVLWPGCNLTVYHTDDERATCQVELAKRAYNVGVPGFGSCWGAQVAVYSAGGEVSPHPKGREMGVVRNIATTDAAKTHPMFHGKPHVYSHFVSHDDHITKLPEGGVLLAANEHCCQAVAVKHGKGEFWGVQYHPEYDLHELARLIVAREDRLVKQGLFRGHEDLMAYVDRLEALHDDPARTDLRWQLGIDDHVIQDEMRQREFINWLNALVLPKAGAPPVQRAL